MNRQKLKEKQWIARESARILVEEGIEDFQQARQKAAKRLGFRLTESSPAKEEIEDAIAEYHRLFRSRVQHTHIRKLRRAALQAMVFLEAFSPRLTGGAVDGSAGKHSPITIYLAVDTPESVLIAFLDSKIPFVESSCKRLVSGRKFDYPTLEFALDASKIEVHMLPESAYREHFQNRKSGVQFANLEKLRKIMERESIESFC